MSRRALILVASLSVGLFGLGPVVTSASASTTFCSEPAATAPCIESVSRDTGAGPVDVAADDANWGASIVGSAASGSNEILVAAMSKTNSDPYELDATPTSTEGDTVWSFTINTGTVKPRVVFSHGDNMDVQRIANNDGTYTVKFTATPVRITGPDPHNGSDVNCDQSAWPWVCPSVAHAQRYAYLDFDISDYGSWTDTAQRDAFWGLNYSTNVEATGLPPTVSTDSDGNPQIVIDLANSHYYPDGTTVVHGFVHMRIPNPMLRQIYFIDDPASMTGAGLFTTYTGPGAATGTGTFSITQESGADAMHVDGSGITFSAKALHVHRGVITPTRPTNINATRTTYHRARVKFTAARSRGSHITGYTARCISVDGRDTRSASATTSPIAVINLVRGKAYNCRVRARSKAGPSFWSVADRVARNP